MTEPSKPRVLIVGAGFAGLAAARALRESNAEIVVIDKTCTSPAVGGRA